MGLIDLPSLLLGALIGANLTAFVISMLRVSAGTSREREDSETISDGKSVRNGNGQA